VNFYENAKKSFYVVQIKKTEINILQKEWYERMVRKAFLLFKIKRKIIFQSH